MENLKINKVSQGPVLAKGSSGSSVTADCSAGYCGPTVPVGDGQVTGGYNPDTGAGGGGYECDF